MKDYQIINHMETQIESMINIPYAKENQQFKPTLRQSWCRGTFLPSEPFQISIGQDRQMRIIAIYQLDVYNPATSGSTNQIADNIIDYFNDKNNRFIVIDGESAVIEYAHRLSSTTETDWYVTPIQIRIVYYRT